MIEEIIDGVITTKQKIKFYQFALDIYTEKIKKYETIHGDNFHLINFGFCYLYKNFFSKDIYDFELLPELRKHKPKKLFYDYKGYRTNNKFDFWFPPRNNKKRIKLCEKILKNLL